MTGPVRMRAATAQDAAAIAKLHREARETAMPWLPDLHTRDEDLAFFRDAVLAEDEVFVLADDARLVAFIALKPGWIDHLAVSPRAWRQGLGRRLVRFAKTRSPQLDLWTFQRNAPARALYASEDFAEVELTDGAANEECEPDVRCRWAGGR